MPDNQKQGISPAEKRPEQIKLDGAMAKAGDGKPIPAASDKKPEAPAKAGDGKATPATSDKKPEVPAKAGDGKPAPVANDKKPDTPAKAGDGKSTPAASDKKPEAPAKAGDDKATPAASDKKSEVPAKSGDGKPAPAASDKKPDTPAKAGDDKATPATSDKKSEVPAKSGDGKPAPAVSEKKPDTPAKAGDGKPAPAASEKKPDTPAKTSDSKPVPAASDKKPESPAKAGDGKPAPAASDKKPEAPAKAGDGKPAPAASDKKLEAPAKAGDGKATPTTSDKKPDTPAKAGDGKPAPTASDKKPEAPAKAGDGKPAPAASDKKPDNPAKTGDGKPAPAASDKKPEAPAKAGDGKPAPATSEKKPETSAKAGDGKSAPATSDKKPDTPAKAGNDKATPAPAAGPAKDTAVEPPKGIKVTQIFADKLENPDGAALKSLPVPQEGEGFSMRLHPGYFFEFLDHPFSINREVQDYKDLYESIKENGINEPVKARPREGGGLELLSGHRRHDIAKQLNYPVPVVIVREDDDTARIEVVDGNLHRQDIPTSELARAAKMKLDALTRKAGRRSKMDQLAGPRKRSDQEVAEDLGMSRNQIQRLVRIESLVPDLKQQVDNKEMPFNTAVELSYLKPEEQEKVVDFIKKEGVVPTMAQATEIKKASQDAAKAAPPPEKAPAEPYTLFSAPTDGKEAPEPQTPPKPAKAPAPLDEKKISSIVKPKAEPEIKYTFTSTELREYFPKDKAPTVSEVKRKVFNALDLQKKAEERQKAKQAMKDAAKDR